MRKQTLLQRLVAGLATNEGVQPKPTEIWRRLKSLTPRQVDVLCFLLGGHLNREIAAELSLTERTVKVHRGRVMKKLAAQSTAQLFPMVLRVLRGNGMQDTSHKTRRRTSVLLRSQQDSRRSIIADAHSKRILGHFGRSIS
jgi:DNA-binding CsgD family transcriptional regulator